MKKVFLALFVLGLISIGYFAESYELKTHASIPVTQDDGDRIVPFRIVLSSTTPTQILSERIRRSAIIQNPSASSFNVFIGTFSTFVSTGSVYAELAPTGSISTTSDGRLFGLIAPGGSAISVIGGEELSDGD